MKLDAPHLPVRNGQCQVSTTEQLDLQVVRPEYDCEIDMAYAVPDFVKSALMQHDTSVRIIIDSAVVHSFANAHRVLKARVGEVEKLIYFFMDGLPMIEEGLNHVLRSHKVGVTVSGIFCHQTPKVRMITPTIASESCELGDIAFLATYGGPIGPYETGLGNGMLVQAKEIYFPGVATEQEKLYEDANSFRYSSPVPLAGQTRSFTDALNCLFYWSFNTDARGVSWQPLTSTYLARPKPGAGQQHITEDFSKTLAGLLLGTCGRGVKQLATGESWSQMIHDLISNAAIRSISHRRIFSKRSSRPSRLKNYVANISPGAGPTFVRCSLGEFLSKFGKKASLAGQKLVYESDQPDNGTEKLAPPSGEKGPPLDRGADTNDASGGGSFIVFQFERRVT